MRFKNKKFSLLIRNKKYYHKVCISADIKEFYLLLNLINDYKLTHPAIDNCHKRREDILQYLKSKDYEIQMQ